MDNKIYRYSLLWRLVFISTVPLISSLTLIYLKSTGSSLHFTLCTILSVILVVPYFFLILKFSEKYIADSEQITQRNMFVRRSLKWKDIIEYRDFFNIIVLMPIVAKESIHIHFYRNIKNYIELRKYFSGRSREYEVNMMSRKRDRVFLIIDIGMAPILLIVAASVAAIVVFRNSALLELSVLLTGIISGTLFVLCSVGIWMLLNDLTIIAREYAHIMATVMSVTLMVPMLIIAGPALSKNGPNFALFLFTYFIGYVIGWGGMSAFFPNRELKSKNDVIKSSQKRFSNSK